MRLPASVNSHSLIIASGNGCEGTALVMEIVSHFNIDFIAFVHHIRRYMVEVLYNLHCPYPTPPMCFHTPFSSTFWLCNHRTWSQNSNWSQILLQLHTDVSFYKKIIIWGSKGKRKEAAERWSKKIWMGKWCMRRGVNWFNCFRKSGSARALWPRRRLRNRKSMAQFLPWGWKYVQTIALFFLVKFGYRCFNAFNMFQRCSALAHRMLATDYQSTELNAAKVRSFCGIV